MNLYHWADQVAERIIRQKGDKEIYTVASGITPSGTIHIGNFREIMTVELVARALKDRGKNVRFIYSWDDFDVFRKVPKNMPKQDLLTSFLRKPVSEVPDTFDCNHKSYSHHNEAPIEESIPKVGIIPEFLYQHELYAACTYAEGIKVALESTTIIKKILDKYRKVPLDNTWLPIEIFCEQCGKDTIKKREYKGGYNVYYECECGTAQTFDFREKGIIKLKWRTDWPMRWVHEGVDYEPGGKDHSAAGGSRSTGEIICKEVYNAEPPVYQEYEWIHMKGGMQFASSKGDVITLQEMLDIYEPAVLRWLFAGSRPSAVFAITFDVDVIKLYEDYDKCERIYYGEQQVSEKESKKQQRTYELSQVDKPHQTVPYQASFRHLTNVLLVNQGDMKKTIGYYKDFLKDEFDKTRVLERANCAWNWLQLHAPEDFKYKVNDLPPSIYLEDNQKHALKEVAKALIEREWTDKELHEHFYVITTNINIQSPEFFKAAYQVLISKDNGPKLANFILTIGKEKVSALFSAL